MDGFLNFDVGENKGRRFGTNQKRKIGFKGEGHFLIIIGILVFVLVVIVFVTQKNLIFPPDTGYFEVKKSLEAEMEGRIRNQAFETVQKIGKRGGYLEVPSLSTTFGGEEVAYWQVCQNSLVQSLDNIKQNIKNDLQTKLNSNKVQEFQGKNVSVDDVQNIELTVRPNDIILKVWMPTSIEKIDLDQPYQIILPIELGEAYDFASSFAKDSSQNAYLSKFIASLLYHSPDKYIPTVGLLTKCGESITLTYDQVKNRVEDILEYVPLNIKFWKNQPPNTEYLDYYIPNVGSKKFEDLDINIHKTGELDRNTFQPSMNPIVITNSKLLYKILPYCTKGYEVRYNIRPQYVVSVKTKNNFEFNFGLMPFIKNSRVGKCEGVEKLVEIADVCAQAKCPAKVSVQNSEGLPLSDTKIIFGPCSLGKTNEFGVTEGKIPCSISQLSAFNEEYTPFYDIKSGLDLKDTKITLKKGPPIQIHFKKADVVTKTSSNPFLGITKITGYKITTSDVQSESIFAEIKQKNASPWNVFETVIPNNGEAGLIDTITVDYIPEGKYEFTINSFKNLRLYKRFCTHKTWYGDCDRHETIDQQILIPTKVTQDFEIKQNTTDIYLTAFYPAYNQVSDAPGEYDYGDGSAFSQCLFPVSENFRQTFCDIKL